MRNEMNEIRNQINPKGEQSGIKQEEPSNKQETSVFSDFKQGEVMPAVESDYGETIWQWDENQERA